MKKQVWYWEGEDGRHLTVRALGLPAPPTFITALFLTDILLARKNWFHYGFLEDNESSNQGIGVNRPEKNHTGGHLRCHCTPQVSGLTEFVCSMTCLRNIENWIPGIHRAGEDKMLGIQDSLGFF